MDWLGIILDMIKSFNSIYYYVCCARIKKSMPQTLVISIQEAYIMWIRCCSALGMHLIGTTLPSHGDHTSLLSCEFE